jgi:uncharacterized protein YbjT (DUF2867 family)
MAEILVVGATGKTGGRVRAQLAARGATVRAASRTLAPATANVTPIPFDWDDRGTYQPALDGVDGVYFVPPSFRTDYPPLVDAFLEAVTAAGVERIVYLSARGAVAGDHIPMRAAEMSLEKAGLPATVLRPAWFAQNFTESFLYPLVRDQGVVAVPTGAGRTPFVDLEDVAAVAVAALLEDGHQGRLYDLSGPESMTWSEAAETIGKVTGREIGFVDVPPADWEAAAVGMGVPADYAAHVSELLSLVRDGREDYVSPDVAQVLGREPRSFGDWAESVRGAWLA